MATAAIVGGALGLVGAAVQSNAARSAADTQADAARDANSTQLHIFNQQRQDQEPWRAAGRRALTDLSGQMGDLNRDFTMADFNKDPGYQFRMEEGQKALERSAAARGGLGSGATLKSLARYSQGVASNEYQNAYNRFNTDRTNRFNKLSSLAGVGQTANNQLANAGQNYANQVSNNQMGIGNAHAAAQVATGNAINNGIGMGMNSWMQSQYLDQPSSIPTTMGGSGGTIPSAPMGPMRMLNGI